MATNPDGDVPLAAGSGTGWSIDSAAINNATCGGYRADIDGLRCIAVMLVFLFHLDFAAISGGFIGVDVFFVISGFLITSRIRSQIAAGSFTFSGFYLARMRRLLPAVVVVTSATAVAAHIRLIPDDLVDFNTSAIYALLSVSNFYFWLNTGDYFSPDVRELPLLHTWSLAVEEQFYVLWPIILIGAGRIVRRWPEALVGAGLLGTLVLSEWMARRYPDAGYYLLPARAFELLIGAALALGWRHIPAAGVMLRSMVAAVGLALVVGSGFLLNTSQIFPGLHALPACLGTAALIAARSDAWPNRLIGNRLMAGIGLISYSLYLWHWPLIAFTHYDGTTLNLPVQFCIIGVGIALSILSYRLVEQPFRFRYTFALPQTTALWLGAPVLLACALTVAAHLSDGFPGRFTGSVVELSKEQLPSVVREKCMKDRAIANLDDCALGVRKSTLDGMLIGDSYANMYAPFIDVLARDAGLFIHDTAYRATPPIPAISAGKKPDPRSVRYATSRFETAAQTGLVILGNSWSGYGPQNAVNRLFDDHGEDINADADRRQLEAIGDLVARGVKVVIIERPRAPPKERVMNLIRRDKLRGRDISQHEGKPQGRGGGYILDRVREQFPSVMIIDPSRALCSERSCANTIDGVLVYASDGSHLNAMGSRLLGEKYIEMFGNPLKAIAEAK